MNKEEWMQFICGIDPFDISGRKKTDYYNRLINQTEHCVGLDYKKPYKRNGKLFYKPYRNYFDTEDVMWDALVEIGYAYKNRMYHLTIDGLSWLSSMNNIYIYNHYSDSPPDIYWEVMKFFCECDVAVCYGCWFPVSAKSCAANLRLPILEIRNAIKRLIGEGYLVKSHYGGIDEEGFPYCVHGYYSTPKMRETDEWIKAYKKEMEWLNKSLNSKEEET